MVGEFPDLQGTMGGYYAKSDGEAEAVYEAITVQYAPQGPWDRSPKAPVSVAVALADKLDTLAGFFAIDERPTGSKDPFALRRAANGAISLIILNKVRLPLRRVLAEAVAGYGALLFGAEAGASPRFTTRLLHRPTRCAAASAIGAWATIWSTVSLGHETRTIWCGCWLSALRSRFLDTEDGANLLTAYRRAANILRIEEKKDGERYEGASDTKLFDPGRGEHPPRAHRRCS